MPTIQPEQLADRPNLIMIHNMWQMAVAYMLMPMYVVQKPAGP
jgi:hypothetical protein